MNPVHSFAVGDYVIYRNSMWAQVVGIDGNDHLNIKPLCSTNTYKKYKNPSVRKVYYYSLRHMTRGSIYAAQLYVSKMASNLVGLEGDLITTGLLK